MSRNSVSTSSQSHFAKIPSANIQRSVFDRSAQHKTTFDSGILVPFFVDEILPGDTMKTTSHFLARLATPIFPYMDNVHLDVHYFFVPNRLVWDNWEKLNGAQEDPGDSTDFLVPQLSAAGIGSGFAENSVYDYLGLPTKVVLTQPDMPNSLILRSYNLIFNEWYRDENLQDSLEVPTGDGPDLPSLYTLQRRGRRKDYFTSALPWPQKGPSVLLPITGTAPVFGDTMGPWGGSGGTPPTGAMRVQYANSGGTVSHNAFMRASTTTNDGRRFEPVDPAGGQYSLGGYINITDKASGIDSNIYADLSEATASTINVLREAFQLQRLFERDARGGTRYVEILLSHFGVVSPDFRLQRPEYLGGGSMPVNVNPIAQTAPTDSTSPQGNLAAFATAHGRQGFNKSFVEHGHVLGIISVRADTTYQQGMNKMWSRRTRYDFYWPTLAHLGEQAVLNKEIYAQADATVNNQVFGYQERFAEYRYRPSLVTGQFRSNALASLDSWHLALDFDTLPTLPGIVSEDPPIDRIIAVPSEPQFILDSYTKIRHARPMPTYSVPGLIDHF